MSKHIRGDGNGGLWISKPFALFSIIIILLGMLCSFVFGYSQVQSKVDSNEQTIAMNQAIIKENAVSIHKLELSTQACADRVINMQEDVNEMKADIKELLQRE